MSAHKDNGSQDAGQAAEQAAGKGVGSGATVETAGAFDIRNFIGALVGLFGVILTVLGLFAFDATESAKTEGLNANLWAGLAMVVVALAFFLWAKLDPIRMIVQENEPGAEEPKDIAGLD